jgi:hypothetical protein
MEHVSGQAGAEVAGGRFLLASENPICFESPMAAWHKTALRNIVVLTLPYAFLSIAMTSIGCVVAAARSGHARSEVFLILARHAAGLYV